MFRESVTYLFNFLKSHRTPQASVITLNVKGHEIRIRKRLITYYLSGMVFKEKEKTTLKANMTAQLKIAKLHQNKSQDFWNHVV